MVDRECQRQPVAQVPLDRGPLDLGVVDGAPCCPKAQRPLAVPDLTEWNVYASWFDYFLASQVQGNFEPGRSLLPAVHHADLHLWVIGAEDGHFCWMQQYVDEAAVSCSEQREQCSMCCWNLGQTRLNHDPPPVVGLGPQENTPPDSVECSLASATSLCMLHVVCLCDWCLRW